MKAMVYTDYGPPDVLQLSDVEKPTPNDHELLIKVHATSVGFGDLTTRNYKAISPRKFGMPFLFWLGAKVFFGFAKPKKTILGSEYAGVVESTGSAVTGFEAGNRVFGYRGPEFGANAEYLCVPQASLVTHTPVNLSDDEAATLPYGALVAWNLLRKVPLQPGQRILIHGASGGIGSAAVQLAKNHFGAEVTGVCSTSRVSFVKELGADEVIDYTREDFTQNGNTYDVIFDILGKSSFSACKTSLTEDGRYLLASFKSRQLFQMLWTFLFGRKKVVCALSNETPEDLVRVRELAEAGKIKPFIDQRFPLAQAAQAHRYIEDGHRKGSVVLVVDAPSHLVGQLDA